ncbi:hypothetical protein PCASD_13924 [Puccinia coronata f. sp. avenae]|uniref:Clr5 domain-containing protein n=1 Tax=Puccinia coronata f. sp. avenae TaxID=200324 RepID=A0A2N5UHA2_9BASI|nr:hypothetical protein PCASD_13924 [Puccinia coronata f. sp. avenae]
MDVDQSTTDNTEFSGTDDTEYLTDSEDDNSEPVPSNDAVRDIVQQLLSQGLKGPKIIEILRDQHGVSMSTSTLTRKRQAWGLRQHKIVIPPAPPPLLLAIRASLVSSHSKGLNLQEIHARLTKETGVTVCLRTIKRYLHRLHLKLNVNDLASGKVTLAQVCEAINHIRNYLLHSNTGYQRMKTLLRRNYNIQIPR